MRDFVVGICYGPLDQKEKAFFGNLTFTGPCLHGGASTTSVSAGGTAQESTKNSEGFWNALMVTSRQVVEEQKRGHVVLDLTNSEELVGDVKIREKF